MYFCCGVRYLETHANQISFATLKVSFYLRKYVLYIIYIAYKRVVSMHQDVRVLLFVFVLFIFFFLFIFRWGAACINWNGTEPLL